MQRPENQNDSVSEGLGYGMLLAVYMNEKDTFDALWKYVQKHLDSTGLMNWHIDSNGQTAGANSATDGDEDMAGMAAKQQWFVNDAYAFLAGNDNEGTESYYNLSWALLSTLVMTGNFVDLSAL